METITRERESEREGERAREGEREREGERATERERARAGEGGGDLGGLESEGLLALGTGMRLRVLCHHITTHVHKYQHRYTLL